MYCSHCSAKIEEDHIFCPTCGKKLSEHPDAPSRWIWAKRFMGTAALITLGWLFWTASITDPFDAVLGHLKSIGTRELTKAYYGYTSPSFQEATSLEVFKDYIKENPNFSILVKADVIQKQEEGDQALLQVLLTPLNGQPFLMEYHLVKSEDGWKISGLRQIPMPPSPPKADK